jgi:hypothetical protein
MPKGTRVERVYKALTGKGMPAAQAAKIAQSKTKQSLATGRKPKVKHG